MKKNTIHLLLIAILAAAPAVPCFANNSEVTELKKHTDMLKQTNKTSEQKPGYLEKAQTIAKKGLRNAAGNMSTLCTLGSVVFGKLALGNDPYNPENRQICGEEYPLDPQSVLESSYTALWYGTVSLTSAYIGYLFGKASKKLS